MSCYCDYDPPRVYRASRPLARRHHRCSECGRAIPPGERYERVEALWDGPWSTVKTCVWCLGLRDIIESRAPCFCWLHHDLVDTMVQFLRDDSGEIPGLGMQAGRWIVAAKRDGWRGL